MTYITICSYALICFYDLIAELRFMEQNETKVKF